MVGQVRGLRPGVSLDSYMGPSGSVIFRHNGSEAQNAIGELQS